MLTFTNFQELSLQGNRCSGVAEDLQGSKLGQDRKLGLKTREWNYYALHASQDNGQRVTTDCLPVYAVPADPPPLHPVIVKKVKKRGRGRPKKDPNAPSRPKKRPPSPLIIKPPPPREDDGLPSTTTRSGRRSRKPAMFKETVEFSSGSDTEQGKEKARKRRKPAINANTGRFTSRGGEGDFELIARVYVHTWRGEAENGIPLEFSYEQASGDVVVSKVLELVDKSRFTKIKVGDVLEAVNEKAMSVVVSKNPTSDIDGLLKPLLLQRKPNLLKFKVVRNIHVERIPTLKWEPIMPQALLHAVEQEGGIVTVNSSGRWQKVRERLKLNFTTSSGHTLKKAYEMYMSKI